MPGIPERTRVPKLCHRVLCRSFFIFEEHQPQPVGAPRPSSTRVAALLVILLDVSVAPAYAALSSVTAAGAL